MKFILDKDKLTIVNNKPYTYNSGSVDYYEAEVQFDEAWNDLTIEAIITKMGENKGISRSPINNKIMLDLQENGTYTVGFVGYKIENEEKIYQISTDLGVIQYNQGAGEIETENEPIPTATEWEIYIAQIQDMIDNIEDMDITAEKIGKQTTITITKKDGTIQEVVINDGQDGKDAKINGKNSIEVEAGNNITIDDTENGIRINSTGGGSGGTSNYNDLSNKPKINNVELSGNKSLNDLGIQPKGNYLISETDPTVPSYVKNITQANITSWNNKADISDIPDVSNFITRNVNNLVNYTLKTNTGSLIDLEINQTTYVVTLSLKDQDGNIISTDTIDLPLENVVVSGSYDSTNQKIVLTLQSGNTVDIPVGALVSGLQSEITSQNKLASDLIDDSNSGNKFVTTSEKQAWNNKLDTEDLTDYVKNTDYATSSKGGTIKTGSLYLTQTDDGRLACMTETYSNYLNKRTDAFISKGTLENVITGKELVNKTYVDGLVGDIDTVLETLTVGGGVS